MSIAKTPRSQLEACVQAVVENLMIRGVTLTSGARIILEGNIEVALAKAFDDGYTECLRDYDKTARESAKTSSALDRPEEWGTGDW